MARKAAPHDGMHGGAFRHLNRSVRGLSQSYKRLSFADFPRCPAPFPVLRGAFVATLCAYFLTGVLLDRGFNCTTHLSARCTCVDERTRPAAQSSQRGFLLLRAALVCF